MRLAALVLVVVLQGCSVIDRRESKEDSRPAVAQAPELPAASVALRRVEGADYHCKTVLYTSIEQPMDDVHSGNADVARIKTSAERGVDELTIRIVSPKKLQFLTGASFKHSLEPMTFDILQFRVGFVTAVAVGEGTLGTNLNTVTLNAETGLLVWTKTRPFLLARRTPDTQSFYFSCT